MKLPDQPSFVLPAVSTMEPVGSAAYGHPKPSHDVEQSAPAYRQTASQAGTRKAKRLEPMVVAAGVVAAGSRIGRNL